MLMSRPKMKYNCREGIALLNQYLSALEANYQAHLPYIEAWESDNLEGVESYMTVIDAARERLRESRCNLIEHQEVHGCTLVRAENFSEEYAA